MAKTKRLTVREKQERAAFKKRMHEYKLVDKCNYIEDILDA